MNTVSELISLLFASRNQAHVFHLQSSSFSAHKALNEYYDSIVDLIDAFVESYQGKHGIIENYTTPGSIKQNASTQDMIAYFEDLADTVAQSRKEIPQDDYLLNQIDEMVTLLYSTVYKLKFLK
jgi:hypothetical protein